MNLNGKRINANSIKMEDVNIRDYPDFSDAFVASAEYVDGKALTEEELEILTELYGNELAHESIRWYEFQTVAVLDWLYSRAVAR